jgi:hypothetical protein
MPDLYAKALAEFYALNHVNDDDLDGTIAHLVFRAQHEIDLEDEGENEFNGFDLPRADYLKIKKFINKWEGK